MKFPDKNLLLKTMKEGDKTAFALFYQQNRDLVYKFVLRYVKCSEIAEDLSQEIFIRLWENSDAIPDINSIRGYLFIVARNHTFNFLRKASSDEALKEKMMLAAIPYSSTTEDNLQSAEYAAHLQKILGTLPQQTQRIFKLCREEEKSYQEVSAILGISKDAVKKHMVRSIKVLKLTFQSSLDVFLTCCIIIHLLSSAK